MLLLASTFEELGWHGYGFDSLTAKLSLLKATIVFGLLWSIWHLPLMFVSGSYQYELLRANPLYILNFFVSIVPLGIIISWIYLRNNRSVIMAILFHLIVNFSQEMFMITNNTKCIETIILILLAAVIVSGDKKLFLSNSNQ